MKPKSKNPKLKYGPWRTKFSGIIHTVKHRDVFYPDGTKKVFEHIFRPDSVIILPFDKHGRLVLIYEFREPPGKYEYFLPAGRIDKKGDTTKKAAIRELREETGYTAREIKLIRHAPAAGHGMWSTYVYAARDLIKAPLVGDENFPIEICPVPLKKAVKMALGGEIKNEFLAYNIILFDYLVKTGKWKW